jgi:7-cyano-7-deazaguanine synthase
MKALVLLSGGLDSVTLAHYLAFDLGYEVVGFFVNYGQPFCAQEYKATVDCVSHIKKMGGKIDFSSMSIPDLLPEPNSEYNSMRNLIMLSYAARYEEQNGIRSIYAGFIASPIDEEPYKDASPEFTQNVKNMLSPWGINFEAPFLNLYKEDVYIMVVEYGIKLDSTWSCNVPVWSGNKLVPCGVCNECIVRKNLK